MPTKTILDGHKQFLDHFVENETHFLELARNGQNPEALWIGCSDSRVPPEILLGAAPGTLFVMRNIANIIPPVTAEDQSVGAVLEYAIFVLRVPHIIICGHTECAGINTLMDDNAIMPGSAIQNWLNHAQSVKQQLLHDEESDILEAIKLNVLTQHQNLLSYRFIAQRYHDGLLHIHNWFYDLHSGRISSYDHALKRWSRIT